MNTQELLIEWLDTVKTRLDEELSDTTEVAFHWRPDAEANSIALTLWHISRSWDVLTILILRKEPAEQEIWQQAGWRQKTGYDPRGKGFAGVGNLSGYSQAEVAEVPAQRKEDLLAYLQQTHAAFRSAIGTLTNDGLTEIVQGQSQYDWISNFIRDGYEHLGEIKAFQATWGRMKSDTSSNKGNFDSLAS